MGVQSSPSSSGGIQLLQPRRSRIPCGFPMCLEPGGLMAAISPGEICMVQGHVCMFSLCPVTVLTGSWRVARNNCLCLAGGVGWSSGGGDSAGEKGRL